MSNDLEVKQNWSPEQLALITNTVAKGSTPDELKLFLYRCHSLGLDPLKPGQIYFVKYGVAPGSIVIGIDGFRSRAERTGKLSGIKRGALKGDKGTLVGAWAEVYRSDWKEPAREEVSLAEYTTGRNLWAKMPETMIKKVAEMAALRMAFPDALGGLYGKEEMDQAEKPTGVYPEQPTPIDGVQAEGYVCSNNLTGKFRAMSNKPLSRCDHSMLREAVAHIEEHAAKMNKAIPDWAKTFISEVEGYLGAAENTPALDEP